MAWYDKVFKGIDPNIIEKAICNIQTEVPVIESKPEPEPEEWIWVEGYKGVDENMQGYGGFQYELGKQYSVDGEIKECENGLHFSLTLEDASYYKDILKNRFFKVKAYVRKQDFENYGSCIESPFLSHHYYMTARINKLAAQKIVLVEEITKTQEMLNRIQVTYPEIDNFDDVEQARMFGYERFVKNKYKQKLSKYFSELFVEIFIDRFSMSELKTKINEIIAYMEEGVSKDVAIYLLMK